MSLDGMKVYILYIYQRGVLGCLKIFINENYNPENNHYVWIKDLA